MSAVARRCSHGFPQVVRVHPAVEREPFPTLYWLTCPWLRLRIDRLEADGWIGRLERRLADDPELAERLSAAEASYVAERLALLSEAEMEDLRDRRMLRGLTERGIGGIAERRGLKCLHLHVGHELAAANPIGELALAEIPRIECPEHEVICSTPGGAEQIEQINR